MPSVQIPRVLQERCDRNSELSVSGRTVRDVLANLKRHHPALFQCVCDETDAVRQHINLFVNNDMLDKHLELETKLDSGDVLSVFQAVSGG